MQHYLSVLESTFKKNWEKAAISNYQGESFTYGNVAESIEKFHLFFKEIGIKRGDKIALCAKNTARWATSFLSINTYGAVVVPLLSDFLPESVASLTTHSESTVLFTDPDIWSKIEAGSVPNLKAVVSVSDFTLLYGSDDSVKISFETLPEAFSSKFPMGYSRDNLKFMTGNDKEIAVINYTSGTTSAPKGVMLRYECFSAMLSFCISRVKIHNGDRIVSMLPMGHIYGLMVEFLFPISYGADITFFGRTPSPTLLLKAMKEVRPFLVACVPLVMEKVYKSSIKPVISKFPMQVALHLPLINKIIYKKIGEKLMAAFGGRVRHFIMGGAALNPEVERIFRKIRIPYTVGYGMTEASPLLAYEDWFNYVPGSCGKPVACCEVKIDSEDPAHIAGEILAKGANICSGYFNNPEASENAFTEDGYLRTGDLGIMDKEGNIFIKGRCKTMILSANGQNIYPEEVQSVINAQAYVSESVVVDRSGHLVALLYLDRDAIRKAGLDNEEISDIPEKVLMASNRQLPSYSKITKVEIVLQPFEKTPKLSIKRFLYK